MKYYFPVIRHIDDVLQAIEGRSEFIVANRGTHTVVNYVVVTPTTFQSPTEPGVSDQESLYRAIRAECRGLIFDEKGCIIRRPLHKFKNINEAEETQANIVDLSQPHLILEKLDGSSVSPFLLDKEVYFGTRMGVTDVASQVLPFVRANPNYENMCSFLMYSGYTPIFEWCSLQQRIVVEHPNDRLVLLAVRDITSGHYLSYDRMVQLVREYNVELVLPMFRCKYGAAQLVEKVSSLPLKEYGEGVVVRFADGHMLKIKSAEYVLIHKAKERITEERHVVTDIVNGDIDDILAQQQPDDRIRIEGYIARFWNGLEAFEKELDIRLQTIYKAYSVDDRKQYALCNDSSDISLIRKAAFVFWCNRNYSHREIRDHIIDKFLIPNLGSRTKFSDIKQQLFPSLSFKY